MEARTLAKNLANHAVTLAPEATGSQALDALRKNNTSAIIVVSPDNRPVGIVTATDALALIASQTETESITVSRFMSHPVVTASPDTDSRNAFLRLLKHKIKHLVVINSIGQVEGLVTEGSILKQLDTDMLVRHDKVVSATTQRIATVRKTTALSDAVQLMARDRLSSIVIEDKNIPVGIVTTRDIVELGGYSTIADDLLLIDVVSSNVQTVRDNATLIKAMMCLDKHQVSRLVVIDSLNRIVGLLTRSDIIRKLYKVLTEYLQTAIEDSERELEVVRTELQAERELRLAQVRLAETQRVAQIGSWELNFKNNVLWWSDEVYNILELDPYTHKADFKNLLIHVHPEDRARVTQSYLASVEQQSGLDIVFKLSLSKNRHKHVHLQCQTNDESDTESARFIGTLQDVSRLYAFNENLKRTAEDFSRAQAVAKIGNWSYRVADEVLELSDQVHDMLDREPDDQTLNIEIARSWAHPDDRTIQDEFVAKLLSPEPYNKEANQPVTIRYIRPDGEARWAELTADRKLNQKNDVTLIYGTAQDITDRIVAEQNLKKNEERYRLAQRVAGVGVWEWDAVADRLFFSEEIREIWQFNVDAYEVHLAELGKRIHPDDLQRWSDHVNATLEHSIDFDIEYRIKRPDNTIRWVHAIGDVERAEDGSIIRMLGVMSDITEKKETALSLEASQSRYRELFNNMGEGVSIYSAENDGENFILRDFNRSNEVKSGYKRVDIVGKRLTEIFPGRARDGVLEVMRSVWKTGIPVEVPARLYQDERVSLWIQSRIVKMPSGVIAKVTTDVSEKVKTQQEYERVQRELNQAHKMEALGQLTGGIAHDFNNILALVLGASELAQIQSNTIKNEKLQQYLSTITSASERARDLVGQMMAFSHHSQTNPEPLALLPNVRDILKLSRSTLPSSIEFNEQLTPVRKVNLSAIELQQLIMNLIINARDAMQDKGVLTITLKESLYQDIECSTCHKVISGEWVEISVADTGTGIDPKYREHLFEPFFTTKPIGKGTGMGLSVVLGIMKRAGGHVVLDSENAIGANFRLLFPAITSDRIESANRDSATTPSPERALKGRALVLDDEPDLTSLFEDFLNAMHLDVETYTSSVEALNAFNASPENYDLILTDQTMPQITGVEFVRQIRQLNSDIPVIVMTGFSNSINASNAEALGISKYLDKPVSFSDLRAVVEKLMP